MEHKQRRRSGKIDRLEPKLRDNVDKMLSNGATYREIVEYLAGEGVQLSRMAVCTYAKKYLAAAQTLRIAQDNFRMMMDEIDRHPDLDTTEGIIRVMSNALLNALVQAKPEDWQQVDMEKLINAANSLVRVTAQKKRVEMQNMTKADAAFNEMNSAIFHTLARRYPDLDAQLRAAVNEIRASEEV
ncbi:MAG: phage protein Gp27 family protein [Oscillospiraceae bacterium]